MIVAHVNTVCSYQANVLQVDSRVNDDDFKSILVSSLTVTWDAFTASYLGSQTARTETKAMMTQELVALITVPDIEEGQGGGSSSMMMTVQTTRRTRGKEESI